MTLPALQSLTLTILNIQIDVTLFDRDLSVTSKDNQPIQLSLLYWVVGEMPKHCSTLQSNPHSTNGKTKTAIVMGRLRDFKIQLLCQPL